MDSTLLNQNYSLVFYSLPNYAGVSTAVNHGDLGIIANSDQNWLQRSVSVAGEDGIFPFLWSEVDISDSTKSYTNHTEKYIAQSNPDLKVTFPSPQYKFQYLGLDSAKAVPVMVQLGTGFVSQNCFAATSVVNDSTSSVTTLGLPGQIGALAFSGTVEGSSLSVSLTIGTWDENSGKVQWQENKASLTLLYKNDQLFIQDENGLPVDWVFSSPQKQADGSWLTKLNDEKLPDSVYISEFTTDKSELLNNGSDTATLTATILDQETNRPYADATVTFSTTFGSLSANSVSSDISGKAVTQFVDHGDTGEALITAMISNGKSKVVAINITGNATFATLYSGSNYTGSFVNIAEHNSINIRESQYNWDWRSARLNGERFFSHTIIPEINSYNYYQYTDNYTTSDIADFSGIYDSNVSAEVQGIVLNKDDIVVRFQLAPTDKSQAMVACSTMTWPSTRHTASIADGLKSHEGILIILNKKQGGVGIDLQVGSLNPDGTPLWLFTTVVSAQWDESSQKPILTSNMPDDWTLMPVSSTQVQGEYICTMTNVPVTSEITVRGARQNPFVLDGNTSIIALDTKTMTPVSAYWQYENESTSVYAERFYDKKPDVVLKVNRSSIDSPLSLNAANIAGNFNITSADNGAFAAILTSGAITAWGNSAYGGEITTDIAIRSDIVSLVGNSYAFAALTVAGNIVAWGNNAYGGKVPDNISGHSGMHSITANQYAFASLSSNGSVVAWGDSEYGASVPAKIALTSNLIALSASYGAFAVLTSSGSVMAWGSAGYGAEVPDAITVRKDLTTIIGARYAFGGLTSARGVIAWGKESAGGTVPDDILSRRDLVALCSTEQAFAALTSTGGVVAWGASNYGGKVPETIMSRNDLVTIAGTSHAFAALTKTGAVVAWGDANYGGTIPDNILQRNDLVSLTGNAGAFAALTASGQVLTWGSDQYGSDIPDDIAPLLKDVVAIYCNSFDFLALRSDNTLVAWGHGVAGIQENIPPNVQGNVTYLK